MKIYYIDIDGEKCLGNFELIELNNGFVKLLFSYGVKQKVRESDNYFSALKEIRKELEEDNIMILCNGSSKDVFPSAMQLDMGNGEKAYRIREGFHATLNDVVNIFEFDESKFLKGTVQEQEDYFNKWVLSRKQRQFSKPKYNIELIQQHNKFIYFWGHQPTKDGTIGKSCLSQWWLCNFEKDGIEYSSTEQWMMAEKARAFLDIDILTQILKSNNPQEAKDLGRKVSNFNEDAWNIKRYSIVLEGNLLKFSQNIELKKYLISTNDSIIVEASPYDKIWGIGMKQDEKGIENPNNWKGQNLLGFALMEVRDILKDQNHPA